MRRIYLLLVLVIAFATKAISQTNVSGGIYTNTTWTKANSPYIVTDTIVVFPGYTLTIEPGVEVRFDNNKMLEIRQARLLAEGTAIDSITFTSNSPNPAPGSWSSILLNLDVASKFSYCNFYFAKAGLEVGRTDSTSVTHSVFSHNLVGFGSPSYLRIARYIRIDSCRFTGNTDKALSYLDESIVTNSHFLRNGNGLSGRFSKVVMENCIVAYHNYGLVDFHEASITNCIIKANTMGIAGGELTITNCFIDSNGTGAMTSGSSISSNQITNNGVGLRLSAFSNVYENIIENDSIGIWVTNSYNNAIYCNRICNNTAYNLQYTETLGGSLPISNNYWCSVDSAVIASTIYDGYDNINLGIVNFMPFDTGQCYFTGCNISITATNAINATCDTCHNGSASVSLAYAIAPVTYTWNTSPLQNTPTATGLAPGTYTVCVIDANSCTACATVYIDSSNCTGFSASAQAVNATCSSCSDGSAQVSATGGAAPYSYTWYTTPIQTTANAVGLPQGVYPVCVTDAYGCVACDTVTVSVGSCSAYFNLYPDTVPHTYYAVNMASSNGALTYLWSWGDGTTDTGAYPNHTYATAGFYTICLTITDAAGCTNTHCNSFYLQRNTNSMVYVNVVDALPSGISLYDISTPAFEMFPNPANDVVSVVVEEPLIGAVLTVTDITGRVMQTMNVAHRMSNIAVSELANGVYFVSITNNGRSSVKRLGVQK